MLQSVSAHVQLSVTLSHEFIVLSAHAFAVGLLFHGVQLTVTCTSSYSDHNHLLSFTLNLYTVVAVGDTVKSCADHTTLHHVDHS